MLSLLPVCYKMYEMVLQTISTLELISPMYLRLGTPPSLHLSRLGDYYYTPSIHETKSVGPTCV